MFSCKLFPSKDDEIYEFFPVKKGEIIVNLGAKHGKATIIFSKKVGKTGLVVSLEPIIENYRILIQTVIKRKLTNVIPLLTAIGNETCKSNIYLNIHDDQHSLVFNGGQGKRIIPVISWDDLVASINLKQVDLVKVDIEGSEIAFLEGMSKVFPDKMIIEEHARFGTDLVHLTRLLAERGYRIVEKREWYFYVQR